MTREEAKAYLRLESDAEDVVIDRLLAAAAALCEAFLGQVLIRRTVVETLPASGGWQRLSAAPVSAVESVSDAGGAVLPAERYAIDLDPGGDGWVRLGGGGTITVRYAAGIADDPAGVPAAIGQGVVRLAAHLYANRDRDDGGAPPAAVAALWRPFRRLRMGAADGVRC